MRTLVLLILTILFSSCNKQKDISGLNEKTPLNENLIYKDFMKFLGFEIIHRSGDEYLIISDKYSENIWIRFSENNSAFSEDTEIKLNKELQKHNVRNIDSVIKELKYKINELLVFINRNGIENVHCVIKKEDVTKYFIDFVLSNNRLIRYINYGDRNIKSYGESYAVIKWIDSCWVILEMIK